ncbi:MAG TPA: MBL fold metallo-hydrolase [Planctomycetota bacterium]
MKEIAKGIHTWSVFSEEKGLAFNGWYLQTGGSAFLIDPPPMNEGQAAVLAKLPRPGMILITNKDHLRGAVGIRKQYWSQVLVHDQDLVALGCPVDGTFSDGDLLLGSMEVLHLPHGKSPGECAFYWPGGKALVLGDALIGRPEGELSLLPDEKLADPAAFRAALRKLLERDVECVLVGDGTPILQDARGALERAIGG